MGRVEKETLITKDQGVVRTHIFPSDVKHRPVRDLSPGGIKVNNVNQTHKIKNVSIFLLFMVAAAIFFSAVFASAVEKPPQGADILLDTYRRNTARLETNSFGVPLFLESLERDDRVHVDVYGIFDYPFNSIVNVLKVPANWCDIVSLHPNVKACTYRELPDVWLLTFYIGRKVYRPPEAASRVIYRYRKVDQQPGYLDVILTADAGPLGTKDHRMRFEKRAILQHSAGARQGSR
jgi:hypothetical protein